ncbi:MAG TPA: VOC family protein [Candidatus Dojkabacteria bacterium]|nr:VOC family protein [Candidatus Dojkabacteria bacterium]
MNTEKLFAICLIVKDFEKSFNFYTEILGFKINTNEKPFADFTLGETSLAIFEKSGATAMLPTKYMNEGGSIVIAFQVKNIGAEINNLNKKGIKIVEGPKKTEWGQKVAYFLDPDKNIIELSEI